MKLAFTHILPVGRTSLSVHIDAYARARNEDKVRKVTEGIFTFVAIDENRKPMEIKQP